MTSKIYHNMTAAANSASQKQQLINNSKKARGRYKPPTEASQLNDWAARCAEKQLVTQFQRTSRSVSPVPETNTTNWAKKSNILVMRDDTQIPDRFTSTKHRNITPSTAASIADTKLKIHVSNGGASEVEEMIDLLLKSGEYDHLALARVRNIESGGDEDIAKPIVKLVDNNSIDTEAADREIAEKQVTDEMLAEDDNVGMQTTISLSAEELMEAAGCYY